MEPKFEYLVREQAEPDYWWVEVRQVGTEKWTFVNKVPTAALFLTINTDHNARLNAWRRENKFLQHNYNKE